MILHSSKNFGGTRTCPDNKVSCMLGSRSRAVCILVDLSTTPLNCNISVPTFQELSKCETAQEVLNISVPGEIGTVGFKGSENFIPGPVLRNTILMSNTKDPFKLILLTTRTARDFDLAQNANNKILQGNAVTHSDNLNAWLYGMKVGSISKARYSVTPDDVKVSTSCNNQHLQCITLNMTMTTAAGAVTLDNS
jgi:hypothetical protein